MQGYMKCLLHTIQLGYENFHFIVSQYRSITQTTIVKYFDIVTCTCPSTDMFMYLLMHSIETSVLFTCF